MMHSVSSQYVHVNAQLAQLTQALLQTIRQQHHIAVHACIFEV
jgi:hypothetical protein